MTTLSTDRPMTDDPAGTTPSGRRALWLTLVTGLLAVGFGFATVSQAPGARSTAMDAEDGVLRAEAIAAWRGEASASDAPLRATASTESPTQAF